jgi:hypothetical protein
MRTQSFLSHRQSIREVVLAAGSSLRNSKQSGIALVMALLLLFLMSILGLGMVLAVNSDVLINGYYGNYRSSYYSADTGLNLVRQQLQNQVNAVVNTGACATWGAASTANYGCTYYPIANPSTVASNALSSIMSSYGGSFRLLTASGTQAANSWPGYFELSNASTFTLNTAMSSPTTAPCAPCTYVYNYYLVALGKGPGSQQVTTSERGMLTISVSPNGGASGKKFSAFGAFINSFAANSSPLVYGTLTGPQWTNGSWNFGSGGSYVFTGSVGQSGATVSYDFTGSRCNPYCYVDSANSSATYNGQTIAPTFQQGLTVGAAAAPLPANDFSQKWAVLDGMGCGEGSNVCGNLSSPAPPTVSNANLNATLQNINGTAYPTGGASSGIYVPTNGTAVTGGGFYVEGSVTSILLTPGTDSSNNPTQIYTIVQNGTTTTITTDIAANTTTLVSGSKTLHLTGVPHNGSSSPQTVLYVDGNIGGNTSGNNYSGLSGPGQGQAAIQDGVQLTIVANGDINVTGDLLYKEEPVTLNSADTPIPANDKGQVLGLYTATGNIALNSPYGNGNLEIDGAIAALSQGCTQSSMQSTCGLATTDQINTLTIVGGRSEANAHGVNMNQSNTYYDTRFQNPNGFGPPWFPATTVTLGAPTAPTVNPSFSRLNWYTSPQN